MKQNQIMVNAVRCLATVRQFVAARWVLTLVLFGVFMAAQMARAETDATAITTAVTAAFAAVAALCVAIGTFFGVYRLVKKIKVILFILALCFGYQLVMADGTDATAITTAVTAAFAAVAALCVSIGTFFGVYRLVKKIKNILVIFPLFFR